MPIAACPSKKWGHKLMQVMKVNPQPLKSARQTLLILTLLLCIAAVSHSANMFHWPYFENDEGTYMSQAHAVMTTGRLAHYTYWYDHAPVGWIQIGFWGRMVEPFVGVQAAFSIESGRVFMLVLHLASTVLIYGIARKITRSEVPAILAVLIFTLSPVALTYQRRVLLDNLQIFWNLCAFYLILGEKRTLLQVAGSAVAFSLAFLSKETGIFFTPAMLVMLLSNTTRHNRWFATALWLGICFFLGISYPLYALLNTELFPYGSALGGSEPHVSLLGTLQYQFGRPGGFFLNPDSSFMITFRGLTAGQDWPADPFLIMGGITSMVVVSVLSIREARLRPIALMTIAYALLYIRGGIVIDFYIIPIIPFFALCIAFAIHYLARLVTWAARALPLPRLRPVLGYTAALATLIPFAPIYTSSIVYTNDQTTAQQEAVAYIRANLPRDAFILIDNYAFLDFYGDFENAHYYWKVDGDPAINSIIDGNWCNVDYVLSTPQVEFDAYQQGLEIVRLALDHSEIVAAFFGDGRHYEVRRVVSDGTAACGSSQQVASAAPHSPTERR